MFRTELTIGPAAQQLPLSARVLTLGSCFADSIGTRLAANKVNVLVNPFGTVFQPLAVGRLLRAALGEAVDWQQHVVEARGRWQSYDLHGSMGAASPVELLQDIQQVVQRTGEFLRSADAVVLTLGTAWAYRLRETGELVSNCHKMPAELFEKELLTPDEIINALAETHAYLRRINPKLRIILTVSPVRHLKDTLPLNAVSKSVLRVACHYLSELLPEVTYFPAYELLTDDLRDYRFYAADMLHPSPVAEDYIWEKFARTYFDAEFGRFRKEWLGVQQAMGHRPINAAAPEHRQFLEATREQLERLSRQRVNVAAELREVTERIATLPLPPVLPPVAVEDDLEERIDIGDEQNEVVVGQAAAPLALSEPMPAAQDQPRNARLSPEEFRNKRGDRRGRNNREGQPTAPDKIAEAPLPELVAIAPAQEAGALEKLATTAEQVDLAAIAAVPNGADTEGEAVKKKKRRSRGGAKRTARKNAAKLAAEADGSTDAENTVAEATEILPTEGRNPRPETKKSSVITKSVPVKRGGRGHERPRPAADPIADGQAGSTEQPLPEVVVTPELPPISAAIIAEPIEVAQAPELLEIASAIAPAADAANDELAPTSARGNRRKPVTPKTKQLFAAPEAPATAAEAIPPIPLARPATTPRPSAPVDYTVKAKPVASLADTMAAAAAPVRPTGVAAGRMRGASATLIVAEKPVKKAATPGSKAAKAPASAAPAAATTKVAKPKPATKAKETKPKAITKPKEAKPKAAAPAKRPPAKPRAKKVAAPPDGPPEGSPSPA